MSAVNPTWVCLCAFILVATSGPQEFTAGLHVVVTRWDGVDLSAGITGLDLGLFPNKGSVDMTLQ